MDLTVAFIQAVQNIVLYPDPFSAMIVLLTGFANELFALFPYNIVLSSQLLFLKDVPSVALFAKLFLFIALPASIGSTIGSLLTFGLAYFGGKPAIEKFGNYFHVSWESVEKMEKRFSSVWYDEALFLFVRAIPLLPSLPVNIAAGIIRMPVVPYMVLSLTGFIIKTMLMFILVAFGVTSLAH